MRYFKAFCVAAGVAVAAAVMPFGVSAQGARCDRACLTGMMTRYLNAMVAHDPAALPVAPTVKFTEDTVQMKLGEGAWKTVTKLRPYRVDFIDVQQGDGLILETPQGVANLFEVGAPDVHRERSVGRVHR